MILVTFLSESISKCLTRKTWVCVATFKSSSLQRSPELDFEFLRVIHYAEIRVQNHSMISLPWSKCLETKKVLLIVRCKSPRTETSGSEMECSDISRFDLSCVRACLLLKPIVLVDQVVLCYMEDASCCTSILIRVSEVVTGSRISLLFWLPSQFWNSISASTKFTGLTGLSLSCSCLFRPTTVTCSVANYFFFFFFLVPKRVASAVVERLIPGIFDL